MKPRGLMPRGRLLAVMGGGFRLPYSVDFSTLADGALPSRFFAPTWVVASGAAVNAPTLGAELIGTNGNMETGDPPTGWTAINTTLSSVADERTGGTGSKSIGLANSAASFGRAVRGHVGAAGDWIKATGWGKSGTCNIKLQLTENGTAYVQSATISGGAWTEVEITGRCTGASNVQFEFQNQTNTAGHVSYGDDISVKKAAVNSLFAALPPTQNFGVTKAGWTILAKNPAGVFMCLDDPLNPRSFVITYHDGTNVRMDKCVNGVYTNLINEAVAYGDGRNIILERDEGSNTWRVKYGVVDAEVQVGTDQTIADVEIINNRRHGLFSTSSSNTCTRFFVAATL